MKTQKPPQVIQQQLLKHICARFAAALQIISLLTVPTLSSALPEPWGASPRLLQSFATPAAPPVAASVACRPITGIIDLSKTLPAFFLPCRLERRHRLNTPNRANPWGSKTPLLVSGDDPNAYTRQLHKHTAVPTALDSIRNSRLGSEPQAKRHQASVPPDRGGRRAHVTKLQKKYSQTDTRDHAAPASEHKSEVREPPKPLHQRKPSLSAPPDLHREQRKQQQPSRSPPFVRQMSQAAILPRQHEQASGAAQRQNNLEESLSLVAWLRDSQLPLEGTVLTKTETAIVAELILPTAAHQLLPTQIRIPKQMFTQVSHGIPEPSKTAETSATSGGALQTRVGSSALEVGVEPQRADTWSCINPGDTIRVRLLGVRHQQESTATRGGQSPGCTSNSYLSLPSSLLELIVQPVLDNPSVPVDLSQEVAGAELAAAQAAAQYSGMGENELLERMSQQRVYRWLRYLSPPTATWVVPACLPGEDPLEGLSRRSAHSLGPRAPPGSRPLLCRVVGLWRKRQAAVVEVLKADDEWHPAVSGLGAKPEQSSTVRSIQEQKVDAFKNTRNPRAESPRIPNKFAEKTNGISREGPSQTQSTHTSSYPFDYALPYQHAERVLRLEQQTDQDPLNQEELLVQQEALLRKVLPHEGDSQLRALLRLCQQHPQLHAYHQNFYRYPETEQEEAIGALALLPLRELATFMKLRAGWKVSEPLRLYFSLVEENEASSRRQSARRIRMSGINQSGRSEMRLSEGASLWFSIYPAVPLEVAHLLIHDMPIPFLAPHLRIFEQRQVAQQQEEHQQLLRQIQRYHENLAQERAMREHKEKAGAGNEATPIHFSKIGKRAIKRKESNNSHTPATSEKSDCERSGGQKPIQLPLHRIPVKPLWWMNGDWLQREVRLSQLLGPYFYRQLMRLRAREEQAESPDNKQEEILDPRGEQFEDITCWVANPERRRQLTPSFVRRYINAVRTALQLLKPSAFSSTFQRFVAVCDVPHEAVASQIRQTDLTSDVQTLLEDFLALRRTIIDGLIKYSPAAQQTHALGSPDSLIMRNASPDWDRPPARSLSWPLSNSSASPLTQLMQLHSRLRLQMRPQQRAPSLEEWRWQKQRDMQRRGQRKSQTQVYSPVEDEFSEEPHEMSRTQMDAVDQDEYDIVDMVTDKVEQQLLDYSPEMAEHARSLSTHPPYAQAYPSAAIRKPRAFYNYFGEDVVPISETVHDEALVRFAGGPGASTTHELFVPLPVEQKHSSTLVSCPSDHSIC